MRGPIALLLLFLCALAQAETFTCSGQARGSVISCGTVELLCENPLPYCCDGPLFPGNFLLPGQRCAGARMDFLLLSQRSCCNTLGLNPAHMMPFTQVANPFLLGAQNDCGDSSGLGAAILAVSDKPKDATQPDTDNPVGVPSPEPPFIWLVVLFWGCILHWVRQRLVDHQPPTLGMP